MKKRTLYALMTAGGVVGLIASLLQSIEKIQLLKNAGKALVCDLNSVFSCSTVLEAWQSSVFGFPNSFLCMIFFTIFAAIGLVGWMGGDLPKKLRLGIHGLALFVMAFGLWFLWQSTYSIGALCIYCLFCFSGLIVINWAWIRANADDLPLNAKHKAQLKRAIKNDIDIFAWVLLAALMAFAMIVQFA